MIRKYTTKDKSRVLELFRLNTPNYFDASEESDFIKYLDHEREDYFVYEEHSKIIGVGGINYSFEEKVACISWDIIDPKWQGRGIGKKLIQFRINHINENPKIEIIRVRTSQYAFQFYGKMGFELDKIEKNYWAKNFDLYLMQMKNSLSNNSV
jgi:N-acetylglutamate synthase-like GNAT family acetyltransferase